MKLMKNCVLCGTILSKVSVEGPKGGWYCPNHGILELNQDWPTVWPEDTEKNDS